jgi:hypothetical protein
MAAILLFRAVIAERLTDIDAFGFRAKFRSVAEDAERGAEEAASDSGDDGARPSETLVGIDETAYELARTDPAGALIAAYERLIGKLRERIEASGQASVPRGVSGLQLARVADEIGLVDGATADALRGLVEIRNNVAHGRKKVRTAEAIEYLSAADDVIYALSRKSSRSTTRFAVYIDGMEAGSGLAASAAFRTVAKAVADEVGTAQVLNEVGPPRIASNRTEVTRPDRARLVAPDLGLWHSSQLNQSDFLEMATALSRLSRRTIEIRPIDQ